MLGLSKATVVLVPVLKLALAAAVPISVDSCKNTRPVLSNS